MSSTSIEYDKNTIVYSCCGKYIACTKATKGYKIECPSCKRVLTEQLKVPKIIICKRS